MYLQKMMLYVFFFVLGFAINTESKAVKSIVKAEYVTSIDTDIGIETPQRIKTATENEVTINVRLKTLIVNADDLSTRDIYENINEYEKEVGSLEMISIPPTYLSVSDIQIKDIGETLKIC